MTLMKQNIIPLILFIFYTVGIVGISIPSLRELTVSLTPMNLLLTAGLFFWGIGRKDFKIFFAAFLAFILGYIVEVAGVATGVLFGEYNYGSPLGWKLFDVPLMIGVNWFLLSFASLGIAGKVFENKILKVIISATLMVLLDVLIEPVAINLDFWTWAEVDVPFQNYVMWFFAALVINTGVLWFVRNIDFKTSLYIFGAQIYFFTLLNLLL